MSFLNGGISFHFMACKVSSEVPHWLRFTLVCKRLLQTLFQEEAWGEGCGKAVLKTGVGNTIERGNGTLQVDSGDISSKWSDLAIWLVQVFEASKVPFLYLQEVGVSGGSKRKGGDLRHFGSVVKQTIPWSRAAWLRSSLRGGAWRSQEWLLLPLRVSGTGLCYFSTEDSASRAPLGNGAGTPWLFTLGALHVWVSVLGKLCWRLEPGVLKKAQQPEV